MTVGQLRDCMSSVEFKQWQAFYNLEPWGWHDREYRKAEVLAKIHNVNVSKRVHLKQPSDFIVDRLDALTKAYQEQRTQLEMRKRLLEANIEERKQMIGQAWGVMAKKVTLDDSSNNSS